ncbi:MAG: capsule assembly Wzi family protein [Candidatus Azobacteroides sp.]|nr:capsule assembly Wzi family protein [Candidatus Azobacteroides sp.]
MVRKYTCVLLSFFFYTAYSQEILDYRFDVLGSASTGKYTPFWLTSNTNGTVPLRPNNGYVRGDLIWKHPFLNGIKLEAEADVVAAAKHTSSFWIQQLYAAVSYRNICLSVGAKERYNSMLDKDLSTGDMTYSTNARPIPEINFAFPNYTNFPFTKEYLQFKGDFALGKSFDNNYIRRTKAPDASYAVNILWHHKSLFLKWEDPTGHFPFFGILGLEHGAQWGGWTSFGGFGNNPASFKDLVRIILCESGNSEAIKGEQINVLGNHVGTYNIKIAYKDKTFQAALYKQHYFDDNSGLELANWRDGIWGGEFTFFNQPFLHKIVVEYLQTTNQSGPFHFLSYDPVLYPNARGGGGDNYYNNYVYSVGWSYFGRGLGNALLTSPEYNDDHAFGFKNNRLKSVHLGLEGKITSEFSYRTLFTGMYGWGTMNTPFLKRKDNFSSLIECTYRPKKQEGWQVALQAAFDKGNLYGDNFGCSLKISKELKTKN